MIYFDKRSLRVLWFIYHRKDKGASWIELQKKFNSAANIFFLESLSREEYTVTKNQIGEWINFNEYESSRCANFRSYCTAKGNELLESRKFNFWKWTIPTLVSIIALAVSIISAVSS